MAFCQHCMNKSQNINPIFYYHNKMKKLKQLLLTATLLASSSFAYADHDMYITDIIVTDNSIQVTPVITPDDYKLIQIEYYLDGTSEYRYDMQPFTFTGLERNTTYDIWVCFDIDGEYFEYSQYITTSGANPKLNVTVTNVKENQIALSYYVTDKPANRNVNWYKFYVDNKYESVQGWQSSSNTIDYEGIEQRPFTPLQPGKTYTIRADALEREDDTTPICSWTQEITTAEGMYTVYYDNSESQWNYLMMYAWLDTSHFNCAWPGTRDEKYFRQESEGSNLYVGKISKEYPYVIFNNHYYITPDEHYEQTADLVGEHCKTYNKNSGKNLVWVPGGYNSWNTSIDKATDVIKDNIATIIVPNYNGEEFKVKVNDTWYGSNGSHPTLNEWFDKVSSYEGAYNFKLDGVTGDLKFTVSFSDGHFLVEKLDPTVTNIEWVGLTKDEEGNPELNLYKDKSKAPVMAYACNSAGDRLPYDVTFEISDYDEPNDIGSLFTNTDKVVDARGLVIPEGSEGNKYEYLLSAVVNYPTTLSLSKQHRAGMAISNKDIKINFNNQNTPTAIKTISIDDASDSANGSDSAASADGPIRWYNLSGLEIPAPTAGSVCIKVQGTKAQKVLIR